MRLLFTDRRHWRGECCDLAARCAEGCGTHCKAKDEGCTTLAAGSDDAGAGLFLLAARSRCGLPDRHIARHRPTTEGLHAQLPLEPFALLSAREAHTGVAQPSPVAQHMSKDCAQAGATLNVIETLRDEPRSNLCPCRQAEENRFLRLYCSSLPHGYHAVVMCCHMLSAVW